MITIKGMTIMQIQTTGNNFPSSFNHLIKNKSEKFQKQINLTKLPLNQDFKFSLEIFNF